MTPKCLPSEFCSKMRPSPPSVASFLLTWPSESSSIYSMMKTSGFVSVWALTLVSCDAFIFNAQVHPALELAKVSTGTAFDSRLEFDFHDAHGGSNQLAIKGPVFELLDESLASSSIPLPTSDGGVPNLSTGPKRINVQQDAFFIGMQGLEKVPFEKGCWEMAWMNNQHDGQLACAFHLPFPIRRGSAKISNGNVYFCFRVYSHETLAASHEMKRRIQGQNAEAMEEKEEHLEKMHATSNPIMKAVHYRNAFAAFEKVLYAPEVSSIPEEEDIIELRNGLLVVKEGTMYRKGNGLIGPGWIKLGQVTLSEHTTVPDDLKKLKP